MVSDFTPPLGDTWGRDRGPAHLRWERASIAMVRTGETKLSVGSALMVACPAQQGGERAIQSPPVRTVSVLGAWHCTGADTPYHILSF